MTERFERAIARARALPPGTQDELADILPQLTGDDGAPYRLRPEEEASFANARAQAARRDSATDEEIRAI